MGREFFSGKISTVLFSRHLDPVLKTMDTPPKSYSTLMQTFFVKVTLGFIKQGRK
jgi:hypothetical protein